MPGSSTPEAPVRPSPPAGTHLPPTLGVQGPLPRQDPALATSADASQATSEDPSRPDTIRFPIGVVEGGQAGDPVPLEATRVSREMGEPLNGHLCGHTFAEDSCPGEKSAPQIHVHQNPAMQTCLETESLQV